MENESRNGDDSDYYDDNAYNLIVLTISILFHCPHMVHHLFSFAIRDDYSM